ncbi:MAG: molecular chaperone HtpG [Myxococcota bacterium]|nr:molecular chaperone HtpG [Myxococcota bacterium]
MTDDPGRAEERAFTAEVQQILHLMIHSLYSRREVFLRELISNASDALDTVRFLSLTQTDLRTEGEPAIDIAIDAEAGTLSVSDNGIGMTRAEVVDNIGTIARSGSAALLRRLREEGEKSAPELIGQFGVGFYSSFMVADRVELETLSARPGAEPVVWSSDGTGRYTLRPGGRRVPGTTVTLHLKQDARDLLNEARIEQVVREYSNYVKWPIRLKGRQLNQGTALWTRRPQEVSDEEHRRFYQELVGGTPDEEPLSRVHLQMDAPYQFQAIVYIPRRPPFDMLFDQVRRRGMQLYVKRVFILDHAEELLPPYLRFLRGVVDSDDLPLNVSREVLQKNPIISTIQRQLVKKTLEELGRLKNEKREDYILFWQQFGVILKEGIFLDASQRERLAELALFQSLRTPPGQFLSLSEYVAAMPEGQKEIYYLTGPSREALVNSPLVEALVRRGLDVLLLVDPVDEFVVQVLTEFSGRKLRSLAKEGLELPPLAGETPTPSSTEADKELAGLLAYLRLRFQDHIQEVRLSQRLEQSPCCLVSAEGDLGRRMEEILARANRKVIPARPILELNPNSGLVRGVARRVAECPKEETTGELCDLLLDLAYLGEGQVRRPGPLLAQLARLLEPAVR